MTDDEFVDAIEEIVKRMKKERDEERKGVGK